MVDAGGSGRRVASLTPSNTEIVAFVGQLDALVAVDRFSDWPPMVEDLVDLGPDLQIDLDRLEALDADLVLASLSVPGMEKVVAAVEARGHDPLVLSPTSLDEVVADVRRVGQALGAEERAKPLAGAMEAELARLRALTAQVEPVRVVWEWWPDPVTVAGGPGWTSQVIAHAGGVNVFAEHPKRSPQVTLDAIEAGAPDVLALCWQGTLQRVQDPDRVRGRDGWEVLAPVREGKILDLPEALFGRPGPRLVEGVRLLAERLHPDLADKLGQPYAWVPGPIRRELQLGP